MTDPLAESWKSLDNFNKSHCGRIGPGGGGSLEYQNAFDVNNHSFDEISEESEEDFGEDFIIPELPKGRSVTLKLLKTWGDPFYIGLNGIEVFTEDGQSATIEDISVSPENIHSDLPVCVKLENLIDGNYQTKDDTRLWLAPYDLHKPLEVTLTMAEEKGIAMIRIWNYNKSRIHATRGVRWLEIAADGFTIFKGEISMASGNKESDKDHLGDTILFTTRDDVFDLISQNDSFMKKNLTPESQTQNSTLNSSISNQTGRPATGERPNRHLTRQDANEALPAQLWHAFSMEGANLILKISTLKIEILDNWGCPDYLGLTGIQIMDRQSTKCTVNDNQIKVSHGTNVTRLTNDRNLTTQSGDMWLTEWDNQAPISIEIEFPQLQDSIGISIWNYNASLEMSHSGARIVNLYVNGEILMQNVHLRKAPGSLHYDFVQDLFYGQRPMAPMEEPSSVCGFVYQLQLLSTWGDEFYVGLNGIELLEPNGNVKHVTLKNLAAFPESVNVIPSVNDDPRSSDKLINGVNDTQNPENMWLTPLLRDDINRIYLVFDEPTEVSGIRIWNYRKTAARGTKDILILVDDLIVFSGAIDSSSQDRTGCLDVRFADP